MTTHPSSDLYGVRRLIGYGLGRKVEFAESDDAGHLNHR
jgi:hypothetical protein